LPLLLGCAIDVFLGMFSVKETLSPFHLFLLDPFDLLDSRLPWL